ncbi:restriction endonuclease subunit S [Amycolatopsis magusensis]|uniref:restriction endonuclease subunit S n=1 Tax=Amycolatopsis magusensis TaxID=882444 RepID=UPI0024A9D498|nr:restriction endonuclease subunit S [Amycolatopsis magusensis]MDI5979271.1 restriction endonuclease subunit S [Amycolatopsis magusensis]
MSFDLDKTVWERVTIGDVAVASKEKVDPASGEVDRYVAGEHMDTDDLKINRWGEVGDGYLGPAFHRRFRRGQILYGSRRTYLRKVAVAEFDGVTANTTFVVEVKDPSTMLQEFLPFVMSSEPFHAFAIQESKGSVNPYVNWSDIARYEFNLPPVDEQKRLADLHWAIEQHSTELKQRLSSTSSLLQQFLRQRFAEFRGESIAIVDLCDDVVGGIWGSPEGEDEVDVLALGPRIYSGDTVSFVTDGSPVRSISRRKAAARLVRENDIILERSGGSFDQPVGRVVIAGAGLAPCIPTDFQRLLRPNSALIEPRFLYWRLRFDWLQGITRNYSRRTTNITNLSVRDYLARKLVVPELKEQQCLLEELVIFEEARMALTAELENLTKLRSSVLADIFRGD